MWCLGFVPPHECTCGLLPWLNREVASAQLFKGMSPKILKEEVNNEKKTNFKRKEGCSRIWEAHTGVDIEQMAVLYITGQKYEKYEICSRGWMERRM